MSSMPNPKQYKLLFLAGKRDAIVPPKMTEGLGKPGKNLNGARKMRIISSTFPGRAVRGRDGS
jgi:hypothetical protein